MTDTDAPSKQPHPRKIERQALSPVEAAESLGVSRDFFDKHVLLELRVIRKGRKVLVPVSELTRWVNTSAAYTIDTGRQ